MTAAEHLALIDAVIAKRLAGDAYESYTEAQAAFRGTSLVDLYDIRDRLISENAAASSNFLLAEPFDV